MYSESGEPSLFGGLVIDNSKQTQWYRTRIDRSQLKSLMRRSDTQGLVYFAGFIAAVVASGYLAHLSIGTWWSVPAFLLYGGVWVFATSVAHETSHGTPFRTRWLNEFSPFVSSW